MSNGPDDDLLAAWALDALSPNEQELVDDLVARDPDLEQRARRLMLAVTALGEGSSDLVDSGVRQAITDTALALRPDRASLLRASEPITALDALTRQWAELDMLLDELTADDWHARTSSDRPVRDLLAHQAAQLRHVAATEFGVPNPGPPSSKRDHWGLSQPLIDALRAAPVSATIDTLRDAARALIAAAVAAPPDAWAIQERHTTLADRIVGRAFELWIHSDDTRAAIGRDWVDPDAARLDLMCDLAARLTPLGMVLAGVAVPGRLGRLVLLGAGGGTWPVPLDGVPVADRAAAPDVVVVAAAAPFCRLAGRLLEPGELIVAVEGDGALVGPLLAGARAFAE